MIKGVCVSLFLSMFSVHSGDYSLDLLFDETPKGAVEETPSVDTSAIPMALSLYVPPKLDMGDILYPDEIYVHLTESTIGQDDAMKGMATFVHDHLVNLRFKSALLLDPKLAKYTDVALVKPNILMVGPTGTGKTSTIQSLSKIMNVPMVVGNATEWTTQGYIGSKWQYMFDILYLNAETLLKKTQADKPKRSEIIACAQQGIVFMDEFDKICLEQGSKLEVVSRVQQELLPPIQGTTIILNNGEAFDTSNVLFIAGGAFPNLKPSNGKVLTPHDLERFGMLPELAGRLGNIVQLQSLGKDSLKRIMTTAKSSVLTQLKAKYKLAYDIDLSFSDDVLDYIAEIAVLQSTGARSLNAMISDIMKEIAFNIRVHVGKPMEITRKDAVKVLEKYRPKKEEMNPSIRAMYM